MNVYAIKDNDIGAFNKPFFLQTDVEAIRTVTTSIEGTMLANFPGSFTLEQLGTFDEKTGAFTDLEAPKLIKPVKDMVTSVSEELREQIKK